jgi:GT2 family glycosyltransferase
VTGDFPKISMVTPSLNQGRFLGDTIRSVLDQGYPDLEYAIVDGGSSDESPDIIRGFEQKLAWWGSELDGGMYDAINKGFQRSTGEVMGWLNADDLHMPWTLSVVAEVFSLFPQINWVTSRYPLVLDGKGRAVRCSRRDAFSRRGFLKGDNLPGPGRVGSGWIQQESTFWRRSLWDKAGGSIDTSLALAGDFELWARFFALSELVAIETPLAGFRRHGNQKTTDSQPYVKEAEAALRRHGGTLRGGLSSSLDLAVRRLCPNRLKPAAGRLGIVATGRVLSFDPISGQWSSVEK